MKNEHVSVMLQEVLAALPARRPLVIVDGTLGLGGHALEMAKVGGVGSALIGIDWDERNLKLAQDRLTQDLPPGISSVLIHDSYANLGKSVEPGMADVILLDLGFSSLHVDDPTRGFSFMKDGPLDMRYNMQGEITAADLINGAPREELAAIFRQYGEEPAAERIAKAICVARKEQKFLTTLALANFIETIVPRHGKVHPATRIFQALRIAVNDELGQVERGITAATLALAPGGRLLIITFHSLEDRLAKTLPKTLGLEPLTKKPQTPGPAELKQNPRARSAKLRVYSKI
jgi:16S rRNA (cytosine1402-N4)-methyltransferase